MTADSEATLLRNPESSQRATFLELFLDLVYVFALTRVSQRLINDFMTGNQLRLSEAAMTLLLLMALWMLWVLTAWMTSRFEPQRPAIQLLVVVTMFASMVMAVALPKAFEDQGLLFAGAYVVMQIGRPLFLGITLQGDKRQYISKRLVFWFGLSGVLWIGGALAPAKDRWIWWTVAVIMDYGGSALRWPTPGIGAVKSREWGFSGEHLAERYQQFFLIALGESILVAGLTFSGGGFAAGRSAAFVVSFVTTVLLWRIYFHRAGFLLAEALTGARDAARFIRSATYTHLVMVTSILATAVGYELVIVHPLSGGAPAWIAVILGGPTLFLIARARFEYEVFARVAWSRLIGAIILVLAAPGMVFLPPLAGAGFGALVLAGIASYDAFSVRGHQPEEPSTPL
jgi:low temperature requirement protein LtrA